jgi:hypothetical protein
MYAGDDDDLGPNPNLATYDDVSLILRLVHDRDSRLKLVIRRCDEDFGSQEGVLTEGDAPCRVPCPQAATGSYVRIGAYLDALAIGEGHVGGQSHTWAACDNPTLLDVRIVVVVD